MNIVVQGAGVIGRATGALLGVCGHHVTYHDPFAGLDAVPADVCIVATPCANGRLDDPGWASRSGQVVVRSTVVAAAYADLPVGRRHAWPEFLDERHAHRDVMNPDKVVWGTDDPHAGRALLDRLLPTLPPSVPVFVTTIRAAAAVKLGVNAYYTAKLLLNNALFELVDRDAAEWGDVVAAMDADRRLVMSHTDPWQDGYRGAGGKCLEVGTLVATPDGPRAIERLAAGDAVHDFAGLTVVTAVARRTVPEAVEIRARGARLVSSVDHLHLVADAAEGELHETKAEHVTPGQWVRVALPAPEGIRDVVVGPRPPFVPRARWWDNVTLDGGWARLIGLYLADGCKGVYSGKREIVWSFGEHEPWLAVEVSALLRDRGLHAPVRFQVSPGATYGPSRCWVVRCRSRWLYDLLELLGCGAGAATKRAPDLHADLVPALVGGWLDGDGNVTAGTVSGLSISTGLVTDLWRLCAKVGVLANVTKDGRVLSVATREAAAVVASWTRRLAAPSDYVRNQAYESPTFRRVPGGWIVRVNAVERRIGTIDVVAIETASGRYIANDVETHNCLPKDLRLLDDALDDQPGAEWVASFLRGMVEANEFLRAEKPAGAVPA